MEDYNADLEIDAAIEARREAEDVSGEIEDSEHRRCEGPCGRILPLTEIEPVRFGSPEDGVTDEVKWLCPACEAEERGTV